MSAGMYKLTPDGSATGADASSARDGPAAPFLQREAGKGGRLALFERAGLGHVDDAMAAEISRQRREWRRALQTVRHTPRARIPSSGLQTGSAEAAGAHRRNAGDPLWWRLKGTNVSYKEREACQLGTSA